MTMSGNEGSMAMSQMANPTLGPEDLELLSLLATGLALGAVARRLELSDRTVRRRTRSICNRLGVSTPIEAVVWAARRGLL